MLLTISIRNRDICFGVFDGEKLLNNYKIKSDVYKSPEEIYVLMKILIGEDISLKNVKNLIISSVVPELTDTFKIIGNQYFKIKPIIIGAGVKTGINIKYENPKELGSDRIVDAVAASVIYKGPAIVVSLGDIITFDVIGGKNDYLGGLIFPGIGLAKYALANFSAKLPQVEALKPQKLIGNSTVKAIQSGLYYSYVNLFDGNIKMLCKELGLEPKDVKIIVTGKYAEFLTDLSSYDLIINDNLSLEGLRILYEMNK
ncbi:type III pantothenate kinase [Peptoniphilus catoniae]|uniref:type III pantothenate kinase n=1 Tax=Peptoniphilus catoniae TaxID=1660341 RepID=UPI0010FEF68B|nr:type III pantothenate kinase [Peptoniphilus catoniae]